ncbi:MAG: M23 family metallopeptidase [Elusimicrobiota bacterium]
MKKNNILISALALLIVFIIFFLNRGGYFNSKPVIVLSSGTIQTGDTLKEILMDQEEIIPGETRNLINTLNSNFDIRGIQPGQVYEIYKTTFGTVNRFNYWTNPIEYCSIEKSSSNIFYCKKNAVSSTLEIKTFSGTIQTSLYEAMIKAGNPPELIMKFADIFSWQIDFFSDLRQGDTFKLAYETYKYSNGVVREGKILSASYNGRQIGLHKAVYFESKDKKFTDYFTPEGGSLKKLFLKAPVNFRRISSFFSTKRFHPILRIFRSHLGIDYSAATGTPIVTIGEGTVTFAGWKGGFGKMIIIRHNSTYTTLYGHLSRFGKRISSGARVGQGQVIGYVGSTGLSTGPHLDFRITQNGRFVNFMKLKFPPAANIPKNYIDEFIIQKDHALKLLETPPETNPKNK